MKASTPRIALIHAVFWTALVVGASSAEAGVDAPTCADLVSFDAQFMGANAGCTQSMFMLTANLDAFSDCLAPAGQIIVEAEDGAIAGGAKIAVFISPCSAVVGAQVSNIGVVPFFSSGVVKFTYRVTGANAGDCGDVMGTTTVTLPDIAMVQASPAVDGLLAASSGADVNLAWMLPAVAGDGYSRISIQRRELFGAAAPGPYTCLDLIAGNSVAYVDMNPVASAGNTGFEYRLTGVLNSATVVGNCTQFDNVDGTAAFCGSLESTAIALPSPTATLDIADLVPATPNELGVKVPVLLSSSGHFGVTSIGIAVEHNPLHLQACTAMIGAAAVAAIPALGFTTVNIGTNGVTAGFIVDFAQNPIPTIPTGANLEVFLLCYDTLGVSNIVTPLDFSTTLQIPNAPVGTFATTEVFAQPSPTSGISQPILPPELVLLAGSIEILSSDFVRGDFDGDQNLTITDAILILNALFLGTPAIVCQDLMDTDDSGVLTLGDGVLILMYLFEQTVTPPALPFGLPLGPGACGPDPTPGDALDCQTPPAYCP